MRAPFEPGASAQSPPSPLHRRVAELIRFGAVGATAFIVDVGIYNLLRSTVLEDKPIGAKVLSVAVAVVVAWVGSRYWTFRDGRRSARGREFALFAGMNVIGLLIAAACLFVSHYVLGYTSRLADNVSGNGVGLVLGTAFRYCAYRYLVFNEREVPARTPGAQHPSVEPAQHQRDGPAYQPDEPAHQAGEPAQQAGPALRPVLLGQES